MRIGIDVGGTNTDAVLMDGSTLIAKAKRPTTSDVTSGIVAAVDGVLASAPGDVSVRAVMLGTTHFTNALLERKGLSPTAVLRLALPATTLLPPLIDWPGPLRDAIAGLTYMVRGGHEFDGSEISPLDTSEVRKVAREIRRRGAEAVAVCGVFSTINPAHEQQAAAIISRELPELKITVSHELGRVGLLERENATALNACLSVLAEQTIRAVRAAIRSLGIDAPLFLSQNDGTLMDAELAARYPVFTIASGPTNSMRGAAFLSGVSDGIVVDVGGTSTDVGALVAGFPREAGVAVKICDVRTNYRMPDVLSFALGGGSLVDPEARTIGPESVGYRLGEQAVAFGGDVLTATDLAVSGGLARLGDPGRVEGLDRALVAQLLEQIRRRIEDAVDRVKLGPEDVPVVLVGGGSIVVSGPVLGASRILRPDHSEVANAIGAAIAQAGGQVEKVYSLDKVSRTEALAAARSEAVNKAVAAGADPVTTEIVELEEIPMTYLPSNVVRIRAKAVGDLVGVLDSEDEDVNEAVR